MRAYIESLEELSRSQLMLLLARRHRADTEGLAVTGLACRLPGGIEDPVTFWDRVRAGWAVPTADVGVPVDSRGRPRWNLDAPDVKPYADVLAHGAYLSDVDRFDAEGFGLTAEEAAHVDPQHRMLLTQVRQAFADAGLDPRGQRVGVFVSVTAPEYGLAAVRNGVTAVTPEMATGTVISAAAGRIATAFGVNGPAFTLDAACPSALAAVHLAGKALRAGECDVAVVGASHLLLSPVTTGVFAGAGFLSGRGEHRPFTARADGYVRGEGCVVLVLTRERDATSPYAVIRGSAVHQHGGRSALGSPSAAGQRQAITDCLKAADVRPEDVGYVEAHGSADRVADATEVDALAAVYPAPLVGSGKANVGYLETASGATALLRAVLAVRHRTVPPQPDFTDPAPGLPWDRVTVPTEPASFSGDRALAGVNAFGFTGTNAHVLVAAAASPRPEPPVAAPDLGRSHWHDSYTWD